MAIIFCLLYQDLPCWLEVKNMPIAPLQVAKSPPTNECPEYDTKPSDGET